MNYLPINIKLEHKNCLVIGAGPVAYRKIQMLLKARAKITCIALQSIGEIDTLAEQGYINLIHEDVKKHWLDKSFFNRFLIISATGQKRLAQRIYQIASDQNVLINTVDETELCDYISPAIVNRSPIVVSISSEGSAPVLARKIREQVEKLLPQRLGLLAEKAGSLRHVVKQKVPHMLQRRKFWERFFDHPVAEDIMHNKALPEPIDLINSIADKKKNLGEVYLVGAGPGDAELLTLKALRLMQQSDVVFYDRLVSTEVLELVRRDAELISVGKSAGHHSVEQKEINELLVKHARQGKRVCRLKGGDPFVFGRGGEELEAIVKAGVKFQIVPGITAAVGCAAYAGIPLTHRDYSSHVLFITGHCQDSIDGLDWVSLARERQTLVVYMGLLKSPHLSQQLIRFGKPANTPVAIIEKGTTSEQRVYCGELKNLSQIVKNNGVQSPALIVIGEVVTFIDEFAWFNTQHSTDTALNKALKIG